MSLGQKLKARREQLGLTLDEVYLKTGISKPYLSTIENGRMIPSDEVITKLERALGFAKGTLLAEAHWQKTPADVLEKVETAAASHQKLRAVVRQWIKEGKLNLDELHANGELTRILGGADPTAQPQGMPSVVVPVINKVSAGYPTDFTDLDYPVRVADEYVRCPDLHDPQAFAARVHGDSMEPRYHEGDIVIFSPAAEVRSGDDCFVRLAETNETNFKRVYFEPDGRIRLQPRNDKYPPQLLNPEQISGLWRAVYRIERI